MHRESECSQITAPFVQPVCIEVSARLSRFYRDEHHRTMLQTEMETKLLAAAPANSLFASREVAKLRVEILVRRNDNSLDRTPFPHGFSHLYELCTVLSY